MGSNFSFIIVAKNENRITIENFINHYTDEWIYLDSAKNLGISINFPLDSFVLKYLEGGYEYNVYNPSDKVQYFLRDDNRAHIGNIDYSEYVFDNSYEGLIKYRFTAVVSSMSFMFEESISVRKWFIELSKAVNAIISFIDLEYNGNRIIFFNNKEVDILLKGETYYDLTVNEFCDAIETFSEAAKDHFTE